MMPSMFKTGDGATGCYRGSVIVRAQAVLVVFQWLPGSTQGLAVLLGQSLKPDGSAPQVLLDRARMAQKLLRQGSE